MVTDTHWKPAVGEWVQTTERLYHRPGGSCWNPIDEVIPVGTYMMVHRRSVGHNIILTFPERKRWEIAASMSSIDLLEPLEQLAAASVESRESYMHRPTNEELREILEDDKPDDVRRTVIHGMADELLELREEKRQLEKRLKKLEKQVEPCTCQSGRCRQHDD